MATKAKAGRYGDESGPPVPPEEWITERPFDSAEYLDGPLPEYAGETSMSDGGDMGVVEQAVAEALVAPEFGTASDVEVYSDPWGVQEADLTRDQRTKWAKQGVAMPDGSWPIPNASYLDKAIQALGRGSKATGTVKAWIIRRAKALGLTSKLPDGWNVSEAALAVMEADVLQEEGLRDAAASRARWAKWERLHGGDSGNSVHVLDALRKLKPGEGVHMPQGTKVYRTTKGDHMVIDPGQALGRNLGQSPTIAATNAAKTERDTLHASAKAEQHNMDPSQFDTGAPKSFSRVNVGDHFVRNSSAYRKIDSAYGIGVHGQDKGKLVAHSGQVVPLKRKATTAAKAATASAPFKPPVGSTVELKNGDTHRITGHPPDGTVWSHRLIDGKPDGTLAAPLNLDAIKLSASDKQSVEQRNAAAKAAHPVGKTVTTTVHSLGGRVEKVSGTVVDHKFGQVRVKTQNHGTISVPLDKIEEADMGTVEQAVADALEEARDSSADDKHRNVKCPKCDTVQSATHSKCSNCGNDLADARKAKFAKTQEAADSLAKASSPEPFSASKTSNWVAKVGGLPAYVQHIAHDLMEKRGKTEQNAIQMAIGIVKRWCKGAGNVDANTRAAACKASAEWDAKKAASHAQEAAMLAVMEAAFAEDDPAIVAEAERYESNPQLLAEWLGEADTSADDGKDTNMPKVRCPKCNKLGKPTGDGNCPNCGHDVSKIAKMVSRMRGKAQEADCGCGHDDPVADAVRSALS